MSPSRKHALRNPLFAAIAGGLLAAFGCTGALAATVVHKQLNVPADLVLSISGGCDNTGSTITLGPELILGDIPAKIVFDGGGTHDQDQTRTVDVTIDLGATIQYPKQPVLGGVTGNPKISVYIGDSLVVGPVRCNKL